MTSETIAGTLIGSLDPRTIPSDLKAVYLWVFLALTGIYAPIISESPFRVIFVLPLILFISGYLLTAALFPARDDFDGIERTALSFGVSIAVVPLFGFALNYTPWGIGLDSIAVTLLAFSLVVGITARFRRRELPEAPRYTAPFAMYRA